MMKVPAFLHLNLYIICISFVCHRIKIHIVLYVRKIQETPKTLGFQGLKLELYYLFENCGALLAAFKPYFFLSFILESLVKKPAAFKSAL